MTKQVKFTYQPPISSNLTVYLVADFNGWNKKSDKLEEVAGIYEITKELAPGEYKYYYLVDGKHTLDPNAPKIVEDEISYSLKIITADEESLFLIPLEIEDLQELQEVSIVGSFNKWQPNFNKLTKLNNRFKTTLFLPLGTYSYKYLAKGDRWFNEQDLLTTTIREAHDKKSANSTLITNSTTYPTIRKSLVAEHNSNLLQLKDKIINIYRFSEKSFEFRIILPFLKDIEVTLILDNEEIKLEFVASDRVNCAFMKEVKITNLDKLLHYYLRIDHKQYTIFANQTELANTQINNSYFIPAELAIFLINKQLSREVIYQIMPDRFYNGDIALNPDFSESIYEGSNITPPKASLKKNQEYYHLVNWDEIEILKKNPFSAAGDPDWFAFYGGDLAGVREKIPYLKELGITLIYLNPIFQAKSPHKYDVMDFKLVDPHFGDNQSFKELVEELHNNGIKVILDIALNHSGTDFFAFQDCVAKGEESDFWHWYDWKKHPLPEIIDENFNALDYYDCWWGIKDMPAFNYDLKRKSPAENQITDISQAEPNLELVNYLIDALKYWVEEIKIDGYRLDVPEEVPYWFWEQFRKVLKRVNPDLYLVGEIWNQPKTWLQGRYFDGIMNYHSFRNPVIDYFLLQKITKQEFIDKLSTGLIHYPIYVVQNQMNLLGSHDTIRVRKLANDDVKKLKLALLFQFTIPGIPHIYYGDEIFLDGNKDPDNRRPFPWDYEEDDARVRFLEFYKQIVTLRKSNPLFTSGKLLFIKHSYLLIYQREFTDTKSKIIIILNPGKQKVRITEFVTTFPEALLTSTESEMLHPSGYYVAIKASK